MNKYFKDVHTLEELRRQYRDLLKKYHPDNPQGSTEATQEINAEYDRLFRVLKDRHESESADNKENNAKTDFNNMKYDFSEDQKLRDVLQQIIFFDGINIEVCGSWIWAFNSYTYRKELKDIGFKYAPKKQAWYWHSEAFRKKGRKSLSMDDIRNYYGSTEIEAEETKRLKQA
ncbi:MAG: J domain-containing protein [Clostridiales bacterium]|nr:J domain-containing protein [Clostridiales bacterium]